VSEDDEDERKFPTIRCTLEPALPYRGKKRYIIIEIPELGATVHPRLEAARCYLLRGHDPETPISFRIKGDRRVDREECVRAAHKEAVEQLFKEARERDFEDADAIHEFYRKGYHDITLRELRGNLVELPAVVGRTTLG
jgi:hypothetical protein